MPDSTLPDQGQPIFGDRDVACLHCGYNLRGIVEPRCPECGQAFDLRTYEWRARPAPPPRRLPVGLVLWNVLRHPIAFWSRPVVFKADEPSTKLVALLVSLQGLLAVAGMWLVIGGEGDVLARMFGMPLMMSLMVLMLGVLHVTGCALMLPARAGALDLRKATGIVVYSSVWATPAAAVAAVWLVAWIWHWQPLWLPGVVLAAVCVPWAISLYCGGVAATGWRLFGVWCVVTNPFWMPAELLALVWLAGEL